MTIVNARLSRDGHIADMFRPILAGILLLWLAACERQDTSRPVVDVHALAEQGETRLLLQSIDGTDDVDRRDVCYRTPLMLAAQYGHLDTVTQLIDAGAHVQLHEKGYYTALMLAAGNGHSEVVRRLADAGAAVDDVEITRGWTALIWAAKRGHVDTVRTLLELGADPAIRDAQGRSAIDWARTNRHAAILRLLAS
jgi:ankyrin repeat protein